MDPVIPAYRIFPLGDSAITIDLGNCIDESINKQVLARFRQLQTHPLPGVIEVVPAYSSVTIYYDCVAMHKRLGSEKTVFSWMAEQLELLFSQSLPEINTEERLVSIPVCYDLDFAPDLAALAHANNLSTEEVIDIHCGTHYRVYMLGFLPGFSYMGQIDERIAAPRKPHPVTVPSGSVGIAGRQTGIYPMISPGGWQIIGQTPLKLFDVEKEQPCLLQPGDKVQFIPIDKNEFTNY